MLRKIAFSIVLFTSFNWEGFAEESEKRHAALEGIKGTYRREAGPAPTRLKVAEGFIKWVEGFAARRSDAKTNSVINYYECVETVEVRNGHLCQFGEDMMKVLARMTLFIEGARGIKPGTLVGHSSEAIDFSIEKVQGCNLQGKDLEAFFEAADKKCKDSQGNLEAMKEYCLSDKEKAFFEEFLAPKIKTDKDFVLLTFKTRAINTYSPNAVSHEMLHGQFFQEEAFRKAVENVWNEVTPEDKLKILAAFEGLYGLDNSFLIQNEFQAYLLQRGSENGMLSDIAAKYKKRLQAALTEAGLKPFEFSKELAKRWP